MYLSFNTYTLSFHTHTSFHNSPFRRLLRQHSGSLSTLKPWQQNDEKLPIAMSIFYPDFFPDSDDLLCPEETSGILSRESPEFSSSSSSDLDSSLPPPLPPAEDEESIAGFIEDERNFVLENLSRIQSHSIDASAREESVAWILKVQAYYGFQPPTAYLAVNYLDRFLNSRQLPQTNAWTLQLVSVACLSVAAKMEEPLVPSLLDLQVEGAKYIFEGRTIQRMELLVLGVLDWRLRSITPFTFLAFFASKLDSTSTFTRFLISRATQIIFSNIQEASFLAYWPSCIAAAAILCAANEIPNRSLVKPEHAESWCQGLRKENIMGCYQLMRELVIDNNNQRKPSKVLPQLRGATVSSFSSSSSPSSSSSFFSLSYKRRKLNNDHKGSTGS